jgi:hypothetical protein
VLRLLSILVITSTLVGCGGGDVDVAPPPEPINVITEGLEPRSFGGGVLLVSPGGFDFGIVAPNTINHVRMNLTNRGSVPLSIIMVSSDCKCTVPDDLDGTVIAPGETIPMNATIDMRAVPGAKESKVVLNYKTGLQNMQHARISFKGEVAMAVRAEPAYVDAQKGVSSGTVRVESMDGRPFSVITAGGKSPRFGDGFDPVRHEPRLSYTLRWAVDYPSSTDDCGGERLWWVVETDHPDCGVLPLYIRHECTGILMDQDYRQRGWLFSQYMLNAGVMKPGETVELDVGVKRLGQIATCGINAAESLTPDATAEFAGLLEPPGDESTVRLRFTVKPGTTGMLYAMVNFKSPTGDKEIAVLARVVE